MSRRPSVSIYNYPEALNPFNDDDTTTSTTNRINGDTKNSGKESKHKFWTFGRSKKKQRSNSFSIKSTWSGLFGKRKDAEEVEIRKPTIATVSSTYKRGTYNGYPVAPVATMSSDQREFDEALGTLARRRKYTLDNSSSRYGSSLTVNGDPGRIYEGTPQETTTSIMGDLTPKPPARRFGQVSPNPAEKIPPLDFGKERTSNGNVVYEENGPNGTPVAPKRGGRRSSQRSIAMSPLSDEEATISADVTLRDENENVPDDYVFKRINRDATRQSNLSINSCVSVGSTVSAYGRKKRRAPQPPRLREPLESPKEIDVRPMEANEPKIELQIIEPIDIARVTEDIEEMTKKNHEPMSTTQDDEKSTKEEISESHPSSSSSHEIPEVTSVVSSSEITETHRTSGEDVGDSSSKMADDEESQISSEIPTNISELHAEPEVEVELRRKSEDDKIVIIKDVTLNEEKMAPLAGRESSENLSRSDSFSVKEVIDNIERKIKYLEAKKARDDVGTEETGEIFERCGNRRSLRETRKNFFRNMVDENGVKVEIKELPREQNDIKIVRIEDPPIDDFAPAETIKIIELHISEPIRTKSAKVGDREVNPIPKPRRHSNLSLDCKETKNPDSSDEGDHEKRGNSL